MAIKDTNRKPYIQDNDTNVFIGLDLPIRKSDGKDGYFASTTTTIEAVKNNIRNLVQTNPGERLFQPNLGLNLRKYLFSQMSEEVIIGIQDEIIDVLEFWLPFVEIKNIEIKTHDDDIIIPTNTLSVNIVFSINKDPNTLNSVQININDMDGIAEGDSSNPNVGY